ncbi:hypothetical protein GBZ48_18550 [Azospirillum melinis]|uniref:Uncharacterized protein n=1 Tax=Azospirillum melinis TaxID=328839 RepID=A0ABX2KER7_9PROT|nr:hypothetical protein [Azospirillum melinis]MBP2309749.1 hypothetical protein [Azospirillum melinis]NUB01266.1 hypothetical protein [Azospirillum melinis]
MRVLLAAAAAIGLAAAPCAWDDDPREAPSILALLSRPQPLPSSAAVLPHRPTEASVQVTIPRQ